MVEIFLKSPSVMGGNNVPTLVEIEWIDLMSLKFKFPANNSKVLLAVIGRKFKFQAQDSFLEYLFWDLEIWRKSHL